MDFPKGINLCPQLQWTFVGVIYQGGVLHLKHFNTHLVSVGLSWANLSLDGPELVWEWADLFAYLQGHC